MLQLVARLKWGLLVMGVFLVNGEGVVGSWTQVVDAVGMGVVELGELLAEQLHGDEVEGQRDRY